MKSEYEKRKFIDTRYNSFVAKIDKYKINKKAREIKGRSLICFLSKKDKRKAYHELLKDFFLKLHNELNDINDYNHIIPTASHIKPASHIKHCPITYPIKYPY